MCANLLIHREYSNPYPAKLIIGKEAIVTENANKPRIIGYIDLNNYSPYPKNPKIANFFKEIGLADELGSGIRKIVKYTRIYSGGIPEFKDDEVFKVNIPLNKVAESNIEYILSEELRKIILNFIRNSDGRSRQEINDFVYPKLADDIDLMNNIVRTTLTYLRKKSLIQNDGSDTKPKWTIK